MNRIPVFVGLDYHKDSVQVCVLDKKGRMLVNKRCGNDEKEITEVVNRHGRVKGAALEACTGAAAMADRLIQTARWPVDLAHAGYVARLKQSPDKSDYSDAHLLADLVRVGYLPKVWLAPEPLRELRRLVRYRHQLMQARKNIKLRVSALLREHRIRQHPKGRWGKKWIDWLLDLPLGDQSRWIVAEQVEYFHYMTEKIETVERRLQKLGENDRLVQLLLTQKGVSWITAWTIRAEIGNFQRFATGKQLSRFSGVSPRNASSGERQADSGLVRAGNSLLRNVLIELAHRLIRYDEQLSRMAARMKQKGKPTNVIVAAVANRWTRKLYYTMSRIA